MLYGPSEQKRKVPCTLVIQGTLELKGEIAENRL